MTSIDELQTGDILLFAAHIPSYTPMGLFDWLLSRATHSPYTHVALVLRDPTFIASNLKGLYVWESSWEGHPDPQDGKTKFGVQITPLHELLRSFDGAVYVRRLMNGRECITTEVLTDIHEVVYDRPYDVHVKDWVQAWCRTDTDPQKTDRFWCSALVAYFMVRFGFLNDDLDWSIIRPADFSSVANYLAWNDVRCAYSDDTPLLCTGPQRN